MKCPQCGHDMGNRAKCLRCGYTIKDIVLIDPEKIEQESEPKTTRKEINPDDVHVSRKGGGSIFGDIFGGGLFGGGIFGGLGGFFDDLFGFESDDNSQGYEYDPKYYDDFGNEVYIPDEFERDSVEIRDVELLEDQSKHEHAERHEHAAHNENAQKYNTNKSRKHGHKHKRRD